MSGRRVEVGDWTEEQLRVQRAGEALHRDGASPAGALELLAALVEDKTWERLADAKGRSFKGRFRAFVETRPPFGLGYDPGQLLKLLALRHPHESVAEVAKRMASMRVEIEVLLRTEIQPALPVGTPGLSKVTGQVPKDGDTNIKPPASANSAEYVTARLKRDEPELAEKVVRGEVTPNAAAREKGWRKPRIVLSTPERVAEAIRKHMPPEARLRLAKLLIDKEGLSPADNAPGR